MSMTSFAFLAAEEGGHGGGHTVWQLPMPAWAYGALALAIFFILLGVVWSFRNMGHTYMTQPDVVDHGPGGHPTQGGYGSAH
ncbi:MAG: hypothetical protein M9891_18740 [Austwickia sp.]|nr:hypothetical protein [Actinomycetota bacterium]MCB1253924.1 hypothetical protein [Austwickia sp.]MCO5311284.1 hypothetical protein [Austwickia sp.]